MQLLERYHTEESLLAELKKSGVQRTKRTLRLWRQRREGPPWTPLGRAVLYSIDGFTDWLKKQEQQPARTVRGRR